MEDEPLSKRRAFLRRLHSLSFDLMMGSAILFCAAVLITGSDLAEQGGYVHPVALGIGCAMLVAIGLWIVLTLTKLVRDRD